MIDAVKEAIMNPKEAVNTKSGSVLVLQTDLTTIQSNVTSGGYYVAKPNKSAIKRLRIALEPAQILSNKRYEGRKRHV